MLPAVQHHTLSKAIITGATALALTVAAVLPAQALGKNERVFLQGVATAVIMDRVLDDMRRPRYQTPRQPAPVYNYVAPQPVYRPAPAPQPVYAPVYRPTIYSTPAAQAFNSYTYTDRKRIQQKLAAYGYYRSGIDGSFGPGTYNAIVAYANDRGQSSSLNTASGVYGVFDGLVY
ncbi:antifreeze protein, type I precursor [Gemmobacter lanyuensis]|jgi:hypothetical protein|uniref:Antifreeze protein, type I n=1 Tax=Gemmobacter lanyuensis TaxID=1054497 RepID=A0A918IUZ8_9RHOB|nr:peptidoglycan-binding protein [Gemmobacter lanyuensis]GGW33168.1 antifreeze protein, type I precursor [Gemmobacter lanyuensis]